MKNDDEPMNVPELNEYCESINRTIFSPNHVEEMHLLIRAVVLGSSEYLDLPQVPSIVPCGSIMLLSKVNF